jgi:hypothetical protein
LVLLAGLITSAFYFIGFHEDRLGGTSPATIDWSQIPVGIPLKRPLWDGLVLTVGIVYALGIAAFLIRFGLLQFKKCLRKNRSSAGRFQVYWRWGKLAPFRFQHHCVQFGLIQRVRVANIIEHEKCTRTKPQHRCFNATIQHPVLVQPRNLAYQKAILQNLEFIADSEALLKISDKKAYQITLLKITAHENCVALSNHFINH